MIIKRVRNERGFTLLEVIIVVVIVAILAAAVIPRFSITRDQAEYSACKANQHMIRTQVELYRFDQGSLPAWNDIKNDTDYFPDGPPDCPADVDNDGTDYNIDSNGKVTCAFDSSHNN
jgi:prepilin-type N-terminal cleavage/methylation domain-containing protein